MTRKDYILIAEALKRAKPGYGAALDGWDDCVHSLCAALGEDNQRFEHARFLENCGVTP